MTKRLHIVTCQDASGKKATIEVMATTDEKACEIALKGLNSWRAVTAVVLNTGKATQ